MVAAGDSIGLAVVGESVAWLPFSKFFASLSLDPLIVAVEALREVAQNISRLVTDVKSSKHHYSTSQATKCECD